MRISCVGKNLKGCFDLTCPHGRRVTSVLFNCRLVRSQSHGHYVGANCGCRTVTVLACRDASECRGDCCHQSIKNGQGQKEVLLSSVMLWFVDVYVPVSCVTSPCMPVTGLHAFTTGFLNSFIPHPPHSDPTYLISSLLGSPITIDAIQAKLLILCDLGTVCMSGVVGVNFVIQGTYEYMNTSFESS